MKTIIRRLRKLEDRLRPQVETEDEWSAREELIKRIEGIAVRMRSAGLVPESGPAVEAARQRIDEWLRTWRQSTEQ